MSLLSGGFTLPIGFAYRTYKQLFLDFPLKATSSDTGSVELIRKDDPRYKPYLEYLPGNKIKNEMKLFLDSVGIREDVIFYETKRVEGPAAGGTNMCKRGSAVIYIPPRFFKRDKEACRFCIKHEIGHIKNNDCFSINFVPAMCKLAAAVYGMFALSFFPAVALATVVGIFAQVTFTNFRESKADDFAIENSSDEELLGGRRNLLRFQVVNREKRFQARNLEKISDFWNQLTLTPNGDDLSEFSHPSLSSRIKKIEKALEQRGVQFDKKFEWKSLQPPLKVG